MFSYLILITLYLALIASAFSVPLTVINVFDDRISRKSVFENKNSKENVLVYASEVETVFRYDKKYITVDESVELDEEEELNYRPIIGVLSQELTSQMEKDYGHLNYTSYIASSYVKFVEAAGARVVPVLISQSDEYYEHLGKSLNGFLFPGGSLYFDSEFTKAAKKIYEISTRKTTKKDQQLALWATCLGFENLLYFVAGVNIQTNCKATNIASSLLFQNGSAESKLLKNISQDILDDLATKNITSNFHHNCILPKTFNFLGLNKSLDILTTSVDQNGVEYISTVEHHELPIFGTQWHPEKPMFEWTDRPKHDNIPHSFEAVRAAQALAQVFVQFARLNSNTFKSKEEEIKNLIYNYSPTYVGYKSYVFESCYFFP